MLFDIADACLVAQSIRFEDVCSTSLTVIFGSEDPSTENVISYRLWHRKSDDLEYPVEPTCTMLAPNRRFTFTDLTPSSEYVMKVVSFKDTKELGMGEVQFSTSCNEDNIPKRSQSPATNCSSLSNPSSVEDETNNGIPYHDHEHDQDQKEKREDSYPGYCKSAEKTISANLSNEAMKCAGIDEGKPAGDSVFASDDEHEPGIGVSIPKVHLLAECHHQMLGDEKEGTGTGSGMGCVPFVLGTSSEAGLPITPCKLEIFKDGLGSRNGRPKPKPITATTTTTMMDLDDDDDDGSGKGDEPQAGSSSKKQQRQQQQQQPDEECAVNGASDRDFEYYVKVIRWLECEGHIEKNFRQKFLTWYSLRATSQQVGIVKVFVDTLLEDPPSLAEQLMDTFSEAISSKRSSVVPVPPGFCMKLWH